MKNLIHRLSGALVAIVLVAKVALAILKGPRA